ncbi:MAG: hypothetical protein FWF29_03670 [Treponema sp.]|nr:hypothetical protein [Treponema sp.]
MKMSSGKKINSPAAVLVLYLLASFLVLIVFRLIFPGEAAPLPIFSRSWGFLRGLIDFLQLFPALALSALVLPFGLAPDSENIYGKSSPRFFHQLNGPVAVAICSLLLYAIVFFLALPAAYTNEENFRYRGDLYRLAKDKAEKHRDAQDWPEALQFIGIAESVWPQSPELAALKTEAEIHLDALRSGAAQNNSQNQQTDIRDPGLSALPGYKQPIDTADALSMGEAALSQGRFYDAHWYATLGERLARENSADAANARRLAARAWNSISSLEPNRSEQERQALFRRKQAGYSAMVSGDWISAYYIFRELTGKTPNDPDVENFYKASQAGVQNIAFFIDEMELSLRHNLTSALFSLPVQNQDNQAAGRAVLRFAGLSTASDYAYATDLEYLGFDSHSCLQFRVSAPYAKLLPVTIGNTPKVLILMKALDRNDQGRQWNAQWSFTDPSGNPGTGRSSGIQIGGSGVQTGASLQQGDSRILLDVSYDDFLILTRLRKGLPSLSIADLFSLKTAGNVGYISQSLDAEILGRLGVILFFLPLSAAALIIGWRCRTKTYPRYFFIPMLVLLPVVFYGLIRLYRFVVENAAIWMILGVGFTWSLVLVIVCTALLFFLMLIILAAQKD